MFANSPLRRDKNSRTIRLFLIDGPTLEGVEAGRTRSDYILWCPKTLTDDGGDGMGKPPVEMSGHVEVERAKVLYKQIVD